METAKIWDVFQKITFTPATHNLIYLLPSSPVPLLICFAGVKQVMSCSYRDRNCCVVQDLWFTSEKYSHS